MARDGDNLSNHETNNFDFGFRFDRFSWSGSDDDGDIKSIEADEAELVLDFSLGSSFSVFVVVGGDKTFPSRENLPEVEPNRVWSTDETNGRDCTLGTRLILPDKFLFSSTEKEEAAMLLEYWDRSFLDVETDSGCREIGKDLRRRKRVSRFVGRAETGRDLRRRKRVSILVGRAESGTPARLIAATCSRTWRSMACERSSSTAEASSLLERYPKLDIILLLLFFP